MGVRHVVAIATVAASMMALVACQGPSTPDAAGSEQTYPGHVHGSPPPPPDPLREGERFLEVGLAQPYRPSPPHGGTDEYRCFLVDPKLSEAAYITGSQFLPQNGAIVHHAILYEIAPSQVDQAHDVDAATEGDGWRCFGGTGLSGGFGAFGGGGSGETFIGGWAPGSKETLVAGIAGFHVEPGSQIVLQVHYNLLATGGQSGPLDQSSVRLRLMPGTAAVTPLTAVLLPAPIELPCTPEESGPLCDRDKAIDDLVARTGQQARTVVAGLGLLCGRGSPPVAGPTQHCDIPIRRDALVYSVAPHMHLLGRSISVELNPGTPDARMLLDQQAFNFDDQSSVPLSEPVRVHSGDRVRVTCTHDATLRSQLPELKPLQPRYVVWGDGTSDEMCLAILITARV
jgi:Copper type II ascorbate-dependent monooxygenase, C-terminal domain